LKPTHSTPPKWQLRLFRLFCHPDFQEDIEGDLLERYTLNLERSGRSKANWVFFFSVISLLKLNLIRPLEGYRRLNSYGMFKNYLKISWRNILKQKLYSFINITGLAIGIAACIVIALFVEDELSYDQYHEDGERIYRVIQSFKNGDSYTTTALSPYKIAPILKNNVAGVEDFLRIEQKWEDHLILEVGEKKIEEKKLAYTDANFFNFFTIPLVHGNPKTVLREPYTLAISQRIAENHFYGANPMGQVVKVTNAYNKESYEAKITGIFETMPDNSHFHKEILISMSTADIVHSNRTEDWGWTSQFSYIKLSPSSNIADVETFLGKIVEENAPEWFQKWAYFGFQPLQSIHLKSNLKDEIEANSDITYVYIFSAIAFFIVLIAGINYMNLATAKAADRAKEVGLRKTLGAYRKQLITQFLGESIFISLFALALGILIAESFLPTFNDLSGKNLNIDYFQTPTLLLRFLVGVLVIGIFAGSYPALYLSKFKPLQVLNGKMAKSGKGTANFRKVLVIFQFSISSILIIGTLVIFNQWEFLKNKKLGIQKDQVINISLNSNQIEKTYLPLKEALLNLPSVEGVTASNKSMTKVFGNYAGFQFAGFEKRITMPYGNVEADFFDFYEIPIVVGRGLTTQKADTASILVNESAVKMLGKTNESIIGETFKFGTAFQPKVVGVVKDFHFESLHKEITPVYFWHATARDFSNLSLKVNTTDYSQTLSEIEAVFKQFDPEYIFDFSFLEEDLNQLYLSEQRFFKVFTILSVLAIFIGCLGIFGLASFTAQQRRKEIGIRKVLGASISSLATLFSVDFAKLIFLANLIAFPIAYFFMEEWLKSFPYKTELSAWVFLMAGVVVFAIAMLTICSQSLRSALGNPIKALRSE